MVFDILGTIAISNSEYPVIELLIEFLVGNAGLFAISLTSPIAPIGGFQLSSIVIGELMAAICTICMALEGVINRKGVWSTNVWTGNLIRMTVATMGLLFVMGYKGILDDIPSLLNTHLFIWLFLSTIISLFVGEVSYLESIKRCEVSKSLPVSSTYPLFVALFAIVFRGEVFNVNILIGSVLIVIAIYLITERRGLQDFSMDDISEVSKAGILLALVAAMCWATSVTIMDHLVAYLPVEAVAGIRYLIAALITSAIIPAKGLNLNHYALKMLGIGGLLALAIGNYALIEAIDLAGPVRATPIAATYPIIAAVLARLALKEIITPKNLAGIGLSFGGVLLVILS